MERPTLWRRGSHQYAALHSALGSIGLAWILDTASQNTCTSIGLPTLPNLFMWLLSPLHVHVCCSMYMLHASWCAMHMLFHVYFWSPYCSNSGIELICIILGLTCSFLFSSLYTCEWYSPEEERVGNIVSTCVVSQQPQGGWEGVPTVCYTMLLCYWSQCVLECTDCSILSYVPQSGVGKPCVENLHVVQAPYCVYTCLHVHVSPGMLHLHVLAIWYGSQD